MIEVPKRSSTESRLTSTDQALFRPGLGLFRTEVVDPTKYNAAYFSDAHVAYTDGYSLDERLAKYADALQNIQRLLSSPILDIGCGPGFLVEGLRRLGISARGVDVSQQAVEELSPESVRSQLTISHLKHLPFADHAFSSAYSFHVLEHLVPDELEMALQEITRVVEDRLYLIIPTWDSLGEETLFNQIIDDPTHRIIATRAWWIEQFGKLAWKHNDEIAKSLDRINRGWVFFFERNNATTIESAVTDENSR